MDGNRVLKACQKYRCVSFDIFDTLLKRDVYEPRDVFRIVERLYAQRSGNRLNFYELRTKAEASARQKSPYPEVTLDEIYANMTLSQAEQTALKQLELETEASLLHASPDLLAVFQECRRQGKEIYLVSDMYLPQEFLEQILAREGIEGYKRLYLSCVCRAKKRTGRLFRMLAQQENLQKGELLHIGDSWHADVFGPAKAGMRGLHIPRRIHKTLYFAVPKHIKEFDARCLYAFVNTRISGLSNRAERLGYEVLGPMIYAYCEWIHEQIRGQESARVWFAARDMYLFAQAYEKLYGRAENWEYIYISRKSLRPVLTQATGDLTASGEVFARGRYSLKELVTYMGYRLEDIESEHSLDLTSRKYDVRKLGSYPEVKAALNSPSIRKRESELGRSGAAYLREHGLFDYDVFLVDVGWHGTTQYLLEQIQKSVAPDHSVRGLYLGCLDGTDEKIGRDAYRSLLFQETDRRSFMKGILVFECLILAPHGSTVQYQLDGKGSVPVLGANEEITPFVLDVQSGAMRFVEEYRQSVLKEAVCPSAQSVCAPFERLVTVPQKEELTSIGGIAYDNFYQNKMAEPQSLVHYILHPAQWKADFKYAPWRIGFLYRLFRLRLPYAKIYSWLREKQGKST